MGPVDADALTDAPSRTDAEAQFFGLSPPPRDAEDSEGDEAEEVEAEEGTAHHAAPLANNFHVRGKVFAISEPTAFAY